MKVYCCQLDIVWEKKQANFDKVRQLLAHAKPRPYSLVVLPEMFSTGFSMDVRAIAEGAPPETENFLCDLAEEYRVCIVAGLVTLSPNERGLNQAVAVNTAGEKIARYTKMHPFSLGGETEQFEPGKELVTFSCENFVIAPFICYDLRFPEIFRAAICKKAQVFVVIANWPNLRAQHWTTLLAARAIENQAYVIGVNRTGRDPQHTYPGKSMVIDPQGNVLADAGDDETVLVADLDLNKVLEWRRSFPALQDIHFPLTSLPGL